MSVQLKCVYFVDNNICHTFKRKQTGFIIVCEKGLCKTSWRLHLTFDKLEHLSTYACGEVTLGRFVNFGFKNF